MSSANCEFPDVSPGQTSSCRSPRCDICGNPADYIMTEILPMSGDAWERYACEEHGKCQGAYETVVRISETRRTQPRFPAVSLPR